MIISIDPHVKKSAIAVWSSDYRLKAIFEVETGKFIYDPFAFFKSDPDEKIAIIESQYLGSNKKTGQQYINSTIKLAQHAGMITGSLMREGFQIEWAQPWGTSGWIAEMLSQNGRIPNTAQIAALSKAIVKRMHPGLRINEHMAAAILIGQWYIKRLKLKEVL